ENGDIVLMHPTAQTRDALKDIISAYKTAGFNIVPISENIG
ncbi:MAG TPA: polysaccharide deacetylase, partial [Clostridiales bacterium]|nr:polysaccharide deacetylase [Clostridiales bacterium]